ncbi:MAG: helix-turn-helix domain-containing protein [Clostridia bacterium]|nr:helix-turn-helix domain-containing protein [Clostridia bacterium]
MAAKKLGTLIKEARTKKGLTQAQLGSAVGMSAQEISRAERGEYEPSEAQLKAIAKATGVTQKSLLEAAKGTSAKPASSKPASSKPAVSPKLTADEKELLELYRKADEQTKESAKKLLEEGAEQTGGLLANLLGGGGGGSILGSLLGGGSNNSNQNNSGGSGSLLGSLLGGGGGGGSFLSSLLGGVLGGKREMPEGADENAANEDGFIELKGVEEDK